MVATDRNTDDDQQWKPDSLQELWRRREILVVEQPWKPVARARLVWELRRSLLKRLQLPDHQQLSAVKAVRWAAVYRAVVVNVDTVAALHGGGGVVVSLALAAAFTAEAHPGGAAGSAATFIGVLLGYLLVVLLPMPILVKALDRHGTLAGDRPGSLRSPLESQAPRGGPGRGIRIRLCCELSHRSRLGCPGLRHQFRSRRGRADVGRFALAQQPQ
jgi:hypothetical protein